MGVRPYFRTKVCYKAWGALRGESLYYVNVFGETQCIAELVRARGAIWADLQKDGWTVEEVELWFPDDKVVAS